MLFFLPLNSSERIANSYPYKIFQNKEAHLVSLGIFGALLTLDRASPFLNFKVKMAVTGLLIASLASLFWNSIFKSKRSEIGTPNLSEESSPKKEYSPVKIAAQKENHKGYSFTSRKANPEQVFTEEELKKIKIKLFHEE